MANRLGAARAAVGLVASLAWAWALAGPGQQSFFDAYELQKAGQLQEAAAKYEAGLKAEPKNAMANFFVGQLYEQLGQDAKARQQFEKTMRLDPNGQYGSQAKARLAGATAPTTAKAGGAVERKVNAAADAFQAGQYGEAAHLFREVVGQDPRHALAWHFLGQSLEKMGDLAGARKAYAQSLEVQPDGSVADRTRQMLAKLPLPDATRVVLPSGLTLLDYLNLLEKRASSEDAGTLLPEVSRYVKEYGPYPQLVKARDQFLNKQIAAIKIDSAESAKQALPTIASLKASAGETLPLLALEARAKHLAGDFVGAQTAYSRWLQTAPAKDGRRTAMAENLLAAQNRQTPANLAKAMQCSYCPEMVEIPAGSFDMGAPENEYKYGTDERPIHRVSIGSFALSKAHVTRGQFAAFVEATGYQAGTCRTWTGSEWADRGGNWRSPGFQQDDSHPVVCVNWNDAKAYAAWLAQETGHPYRLPTEAEWEYAARAGTTTARFWGDSPDQACQYASVWDSTGRSQVPGMTHEAHSCSDGYAYTAPGASFKPNGFGLYDMLGNAWQWVEDCYHDNYSGAPADGSAWTSGECKYRVLRGGSWGNGPPDVRSASRLNSVPSYRYGSVGFRVARMLP